MMTPDRFLGPLHLGFEAARTIIDAQAVMAMRMAGMMGLWTVSHRETSRMFQEKPRAAVKSAIAMQKAMAAGQTPDQVMRAGLEPISRKVGKNARRLAAKGPRRG
jgi:hypothetical protein